MPPLVIREEYLSDDRLSLLEAAMLSEVKNLHEAGGCYASRKHFSTRLKCSEFWVTKTKNTLIERGFLIEKAGHLVTLTQQQSLATKQQSCQIGGQQSLGEQQQSCTQKQQSLGPSKQETNKKLTRIKNIKKEEPEWPSPEKDSLGNGCPSFVRFYTSYPKHEGRQNAYKSWFKLKPSAELLGQILDHVAEMKAHSRKWREGYIPAPTTYINQNRWTDEIDYADKRRGAMADMFTAAKPKTFDRGSMIESLWDEDGNEVLASDPRFAALKERMNAEFTAGN